VVEQDEIEAIVAKRFEQFENGLTMTDVKNKMLNLKVRAQPNQLRGSTSYFNEESNQDKAIEQLRLEMVEELRKVREDLRSTNQSN
jgi:hypothetical protein